MLLELVGSAVASGGGVRVQGGLSLALTLLTKQESFSPAGQSGGCYSEFL